MSHTSLRYGLAALLVAWGIDLLFWETPPGVSFFIWTLLAMGAGFGLAALDKVRPSAWSYVLALAGLALSAVTFLRSESMTVFLSFCLSLGSLMLLAATFRTGNWVAYRLWDYVPAFFNLVIAVLLRPVELFRVPKPALAAAGDPSAAAGVPSAASVSWRGTGRITGRVLIGLLIALPVVAVFGSLLSSADPIFSNQMADFFKLFDLRRLGEYLFRLLYVLLLAYIFAGVYLHALRPSKDETRPQSGSVWLKPFLGWIEAGIVLALVDLMFAVFVAIQFWYFFGGQANISTSGFTYADYARRGFFELLAVAVLSLALYLALATVTRRETPFQKRSFTVLSILLMAMVLIMLVSAFQRLLLYESAYGYTQLRVVTHIFMLWLGLLLAAAIAFELLQRRRHFGLALLLTGLGFGLTLGFFNIEAMIAGQNVARARSGATQVASDSGVPRSLALDAVFLNSLGPDAVPTLIDEYRRPDLPQAIRDALGAGLACRTYDLIHNPVQTDWRSFNLSKSTAANLLLAGQGEWSAYHVAAGDRGLSVTVQGQELPCDYSPSMD